MLGGRNEYLQGLVSDAREGDGNSFGVIFAYTYSRVYEKCRIYLEREYDIQDVMLATYLNAYNRLSEVGNAQHVERWISLICDGNINSFLAKKKLSRREAKILVKKSSTKSASMISTENAQQIFDSVLILSGAPTDDLLPLEALLAYHQYRNNRLLLQRGLLLIVILALVLIPFFALSPDMELSYIPGSNNGSYLKYTINVKTLVPVDYVEATLNGNSVTTMIENDNMYLSYITDNGEYKVTTTLVNGKTVTKSVIITEFDDIAPEVDNYYLSDGNLVIVCHDEGSGLDFENTIVTKLSDGTIMNAISYDEETGSMTFVYIPGDSALSLLDKAGNKKTYTIE